MKAISVQSFKVSKLFAEWEYVIPAFQRPYSWIDKEQCQQLWEDLTEFYDSNQNTKTTWFLGSIVLCKTSSTDDASMSDAVRYVVDGQQRLTTLFILLAVLKNRFNTYKGLSGNLRPTDQLTGNLDSRARIRSLVPEDMDYAGILDQLACDNEIVYDEKVAKSNFVRNFEYFTRQLDEWIRKVDLNDGQAVLYKQGFVKFLLNRVELLGIECEDEEDAFRVFEVVNDRGLELSAVQIVKPRLMQRLDDDERKRFLEDWGRWTNVDEKKEDNTPLISFLFQTLKEIRSVAKVGNPDYQKTSLSKFFQYETLENVQTDINKLFAIHKWNPPDELFILMAILNQITSKTYKVLLYSYFFNLGKVNKSGDFALRAKDVKKAVKFCRDLVRFLYGLSIVGKTSRDDMRRPCYDQVKWVFDKKAMYKLRLEKADLKEVKRRFDDNFEKVDCYKRGYLTGLILLASYLYAEKGKGRKDRLAKLLRNGFEREHICPRKSGYAWAGAWTRETHAELVNSIGNLIPLEEEINLDAKNNSFAIKRDGERGSGSFRDQKGAVGYKKSVSPEANEYLGKHGDEWLPDDVRQFAKRKCSLILKFLEAGPECIR